MRSLIVLRRPGISVVSGIIAEVGVDEVLLKNDLTGAVSGQTKTAVCRLRTDPDVIRKMRLCPGTAVIASATDDIKIEMIQEGGEFPDLTLDLTSRIIRFNGSFDFDRHEREKEQRVFCGSILNAKSQQKGSRWWNKAVVCWKHKGVDEIRNVVYWSNGEDRADKNMQKRMIFVTGEKKEVGSVALYQADKVLTI